MTPSPGYQRALLLYEHGRHAEAAEHFRNVLAESPQFAPAHAMLSLCLTRLDQLEPATDEARLAIEFGPELPLAFYAFAQAMFARNRDADSRQAIEQAIALDRLNPLYHGLLAQLYLRQRQWRMALQAADEGLAHDPEHVVCLNVRANALVQLGERDRAAATVADALQKNPEDAYMHANRGWALLHAGQPKPAMHHFREALRLDPNNRWAKAGVVESLKASFFLYRWLLMYFLWMARLPAKVQNGILFGGFIGYQLLRQLSIQSPAVRPFVVPLLIAYVGFALLTWLGSALLNLLLRLHPVGKYALAWPDRRSSELVGALLLIAAALIVFSLTSGRDPNGIALLIGVTAFATSLPASRIFYCDNGWPRFAAIGLSLAVMACGLFVVFSENADALTAFVVVSIVAQFGSMQLVAVRQRR